jgi:hypothetical protein
MTRFTLRTLCLFAAVVLGACDSETEERPPPSDLSVVNAAPGFENLVIRRGRTSVAEVGNLVYGARVTRTFDSDTYNFTVETFDSIKAEVVERATFTDELIEGQKHLFVLAEQGGAVTPLRFARPRFDESSANWELNVVHAVAGAPAVDVYAVPTGTDITGTTPAASVAFGQLVTSGTLPPGSYEFTLTEAGNQANVLFVSTPIEFPAGLSTEVTIAADQNGVPNRFVLIGTSTSGDFSLGDSQIPATARFINGVSDELARDVYLDGDFTTPFADDIVYAAVGDFVNLPDGTSQISITPSDNASVVEAELTDLITPGDIHNVLIAGSAGNVTAAVAIENQLPNNEYARLSFLSTVNAYAALSIYVVSPGTDISNSIPNLVLTAPGASPRNLIAGGTYEIIVQDAESDTIALSPLSLTMGVGGIYTVLLYDSGDGTTVSAALLDDFQ